MLFVQLPLNFYAHRQLRWMFCAKTGFWPEYFMWVSSLCFILQLANIHPIPVNVTRAVRFANFSMGSFQVGWIFRCEFESPTLNEEHRCQVRVERGSPSNFHARLLSNPKILLVVKCTRGMCLWGIGQSQFLRFSLTTSLLNIICHLGIQAYVQYITRYFDMFLKFKRGFEFHSNLALANSDDLIIR